MRARQLPAASEPLVAVALLALLAVAFGGLLYLTRIVDEQRVPFSTVRVLSNRLIDVSEMSAVEEAALLKPTTSVFLPNDLSKKV